MLAWAKNIAQTAESAMLLTTSEMGINALQHHTHTEVKSHMEISVMGESRNVHWGKNTHLLLLKMNYNLLLTQLISIFSH